jgi:cellobiose phosphorylase
MYRTGIETILGFKLNGNKLRIEPNIHPDWKFYKIRYIYMSAIYEIEFQKTNQQSSEKIKYLIDGYAVPEDEGGFLLTDDGRNHSVIVTFNKEE